MPTVLSNINDLIAKGIIIETGEYESTVCPSVCSCPCWTRFPFSSFIKCIVYSFLHKSLSVCLKRDKLLTRIYQLNSLYIFCYS